MDYRATTYRKPGMCRVPVVLACLAWLVLVAQPCVAACCADVDVKQHTAHQAPVPAPAAGAPASGCDHPSCPASPDSLADVLNSGLEKAGVPDVVLYPTTLSMSAPTVYRTPRQEVRHLTVSVALRWYLLTRRLRL